MPWTLVYANPAISKPEKGNLDQLCNAIESGANIRIGLDEWEETDVLCMRWNTESVRFNKERTMAIAAFSIHASNLHYNSNTGKMYMAPESQSADLPAVCIVRSDGIEHMFTARGVEYFISDKIKTRQYQWFADL